MKSINHRNLFYVKLSVAFILALFIVFAFNFFTLQTPLNEVLKRNGNNDISVSARYGYWIAPNVVVYDLRDVSENNSPADVTRIFFQYAEAMQDRRFDKVYLAWRGERKFYMQGKHFQRLGEEYSFQNPVYLTRTLPENLYRLDGEQAYPTWEGGLLGVLSKQMEEFNQFNREWYINDLFDLTKK